MQPTQPDVAQSLPDAGIELPKGKKECQALLRELGYTGYKIDAIWEDRVFLLTKAVYDMGRQAMVRRAETIVFVERTDVDGRVHGVDVQPYTGWYVG